MDLLVEDTVVARVKSVTKLDRVHSAQMLSYLTLSKCIGLLINFNVTVLADWINAAGERFSKIVFLLSGLSVLRG
jgi:GxxExxY protein